MKWRVDSLGRIYDPGEDKVVYFDPASGDTHLIGSFAAYLIQQLSGRELSTDELVTLVSPDIDPEDQTEMTGAIPKILEALVDMDILKRV